MSAADHLQFKLPQLNNASFRESCKDALLPGRGEKSVPANAGLVKPSKLNRLQVHFSSAKEEWATPQALFDALSEAYGGFTLDPAASAANAKCKQFYTRAEDGLAHPWPGRVFLNPPYGSEIGKWVRKAYEESFNGSLVVCLLPSRTDTRWWHQWAKRGHIHYLPGRVKFGDAKHAAPFPSAVVTFGRFHNV